MKKIAMILAGIALLLLAGWGLVRLDAQPDQAAPQTQEKTTAPDAVQAFPSTADLREQAVHTLMSGMTDEEKVGQLFFARCPVAGEAEQAAQYHLGGYVLFGRNFSSKTPETLREMLAQCQAASKVPMLMGVDEEGGTVVRASYYQQFRQSRFLSPQKLIQAGGMDAVTGDAREKATFLKDLGLNVNLAPVCDVAPDKDNYMYPRTFGVGAADTADYVRAVVEQTQENGVGCVLKHFPGYGGNGDTHAGVVRDERPLETFYESDLLPFQAGIEAGAGCVLVSHNIVEAMDAKHPASLSSAVYEVLRRELGSQVVALTDDLAMDAVTEYTDGADAAVRALEAGGDLLLSSDISVQYPAVLQALKDGTLQRARVDEAVARVLGWKYDLGLL